MANPEGGLLFVDEAPPHRRLHVSWTMPFTNQYGTHEGNVGICDGIQLSMQVIIDARIVVSPTVARKLAAALCDAADRVERVGAPEAAVLP